MNSKSDYNSRINQDIDFYKNKNNESLTQNIDDINPNGANTLSRNAMDINSRQMATTAEACMNNSECMRLLYHNIYNTNRKEYLKNALYGQPFEYDEKQKPLYNSSILYRGNQTVNNNNLESNLENNLESNLENNYENNYENNLESNNNLNSDYPTRSYNNRNTHYKYFNQQ
jgi:hypothetical protein